MLSLFHSQGVRVLRGEQDVTRKPGHHFRSDSLAPPGVGRCVNAGPAGDELSGSAGGVPHLPPPPGVWTRAGEAMHPSTSSAHRPTPTDPHQDCLPHDTGCQRPKRGRSDLSRASLLAGGKSWCHKLLSPADISHCIFLACL